MYIIFLGAPGAGKGTQAVKVAQQLKLVTVASGDLLRQALAQGSEVGLLAKPYMEKGKLIPDEIMIRMILERIAAPECKNGVILDGFPRNLKQAEALDKALAQKGKIIDKVAYIKVSEKELVERLSGRWVCRQCQTPYHIKNNPPKVWGKCDRCGGELYQRADDTAETVKKRLLVYFAETAPLINYYTQTGKLAEVDGEGDIDAIEGRVMKALRGRLPA
ncbi:MAG: adenylate kinase [Dehalococcoidales bacterium]|nr:adenylate kinase [Dehalococcoidales bacterium]